MIDWPQDVNKEIKRETDWEIPNGTIREETRCGKTKTRPSEVLAPKVYNVSMQFDYAEYLTFQNWYEINLRHGALSFAFPDIFTGLVDREYRIVSGINGSNQSGKIIRVNMEWEEL